MVSNEIVTLSAGRVGNLVEVLGLVFIPKKVILNSIMYGKVIVYIG